MGRHAKGWELVWRNGLAYVRFRHGGKRIERATSQRDAREASKKAGEIYARCLRGAPVPKKRIVATAADLEDLLSAWVDSRRAELSPGSIETLEIYNFHLAKFFVDLQSIQTATIRQYSQQRLTKVLRRTLRKELSALRMFLAWCEEWGYVESVPLVPLPARTAMGTVHFKRKPEPVPISNKQALALLDALAETYTLEGRTIPVRSFIEVLWETGLRPKTVRSLKSPEHWSRGAKFLRITTDIDKARFARDVPLTPRAQAALGRALAMNGAGFIFGGDGRKIDYRKSLRTAAHAAKIDEWEKVTLYDLRHARALHFLERGADLAGTAYLLGHKQVTTTNRYLHPKSNAGSRVIKALSGENRVNRRK